MKSKFYQFLLLIETILVSTTYAQTGVSISQSDFSTQQAAWSANGNASFGTINSGSPTALILTASSGNQAGTAFWKQKITLGSGGSFSAFFSYLIDQNNSRADGFTFMLQQQSPTATAATGGGLGYSGFTGKSLAVEFDTYNNNSYDPDNNHIAIDLNGNVNHSNNGGLVQSISTSTLDLADANVKYVWVDYNGSTNLLEVRISYSNVRPTTATISTTNFNLSTMFTSPNVYMGFSGGTGGCWERHSITSFYAINQYSPINPATNTYVQDAMNITMTSSSSTIPANGSNLPITITLTDGGGSPLVNQPVTLSILTGSAVLSLVSGTTNSSGQLVVNLSSTTSGSVTVKSIAGFGGLSTSSTYSISSTLPLVMNNFTASIQNTSVELNWNILSVFNGKNIVIMRSADGINFDSIGNLDIDAQTSYIGSNTYFDRSPLPGINYYKLQLNNLDGLTSYSNIVFVNFTNTSTGLTIMGNPVVNDLKMMGLNNNPGTVQIYDIMGKIRNELSISGNTGTLDISCANLPSGSYFVRVSQNNISQTLKFIKQ